MKYTYTHPITVRYRDLDLQGHVNNAVYLSYLESARLGYYQQAGIWQPNAGKNTGMVVARIEIDYLTPIFLGQHLQVRLAVSRIGTKSLTFEFQFDDSPGGVVCARGKSIMVTYDSDKGESIPVPEEWREKINNFEAQKERDETA